MSRARVTLLLAVASQAAVSMIQFALPAIAPDIQRTLHLGAAGFGTVYAAVGIGATLALLPTGVCVDRFGSRVVLLAGTGIAATGDVLAGVAPNATVFGAAMFLAGIGGSTVPVAGMTTLLREFPPARRGVVMGWRQLAVPLGGLIGAIVLPLLTSLGGVRLALCASAAVVLVAGLAFSTILAHERGESRGFRLDGVLRVPGMRLLIGVGICYGAALGATLTYIVPAGRDAGLSAGETQAVFIALNISAALARLAWGRAADRRGGSRRARTLVDIGLVTTLAAIAVPFALHAGPGPAVAAATVLSFGAFGFNAIVYLIAGERSGGARAGRGVGVASMAVFGSSSVVSPLVGLLIDRTGYDVVWAVTAALGAAGTLFAVALLRVTQAHDASAARTPRADRRSRRAAQAGVGVE